MPIGRRSLLAAAALSPLVGWAAAASEAQNVVIGRSALMPGIIVGGGSIASDPIDCEIGATSKNLPPNTAIGYGLCRGTATNSRKDR